MKFKYTKAQLVIETIGIIALLGMIVFVAFKWNNLPSQIPAHYNAQGAVDRWGGKNQILFLPVVSVFLYVLLSVVSFFPKSWNMPTKVTEENKTAVYNCMKTMIITMKAELVGVFFYITYQMANKATLAVWFLPAFLVVLIGTIILFTVRTVEKAK